MLPRHSTYSSVNFHRVKGSFYCDTVPESKLPEVIVLLRLFLFFPVLLCPFCAFILSKSICCSQGLFLRLCRSKTGGLCGQFSEGTLYSVAVLSGNFTEGNFLSCFFPVHVVAFSFPKETRGTFRYLFRRQLSYSVLFHYGPRSRGYCSEFNFLSCFRPFRRLPEVVRAVVQMVPELDIHWPYDCQFALQMFLRFPFIVPEVLLVRVLIRVS